MPFIESSQSLSPGKHKQLYLKKRWKDHISYSLAKLVSFAYQTADIFFILRYPITWFLKVKCYLYNEPFDTWNIILQNSYLPVQKLTEAKKTSVTTCTHHSWNLVIRLGLQSWKPAKGNSYRMLLKAGVLAKAEQNRGGRRGEKWLPKPCLVCFTISTRLA